MRSQHRMAGNAPSVPVATVVMPYQASRGTPTGCRVANEAINDSEFVRFADNCAMQIAAMSPVVVGKTDLSDLQVAKQKEIFEAQLKEENKPEKAWSKINEGKLAKRYTEVTLLGQDRVWRDSDEDAGGTIDACRVALGKKLGGEIVVTAFLRFALGEGLEKKVDNLADDVAKLAAS